MANLFERIREMEEQSREADLEADFNKTRAFIEANSYQNNQAPMQGNPSQENPRQLQGVADLLATRGRYGDSMMVHMNPIEVEGLAAMSPTGSLTTNPDTGQPEAFLPFLLPLLGGLGGSALAGSALLSSTALAGKAALLGAIGSGLGSYAATGDPKQALLSGVTGFGIGSALGAGSSTAKEIAVQEALNTAGVSTVDAAAKTAMTVAEQAAVKATQDAARAALSQATQDTITSKGVQAAQDAILNPFSKAGLTALTSPTTLIAAGIGEGTNMQIRADKLLEEQNKAFDRDNAESYEGAKRRLEANVYSEDIKPVDDYANYASGGGITSVDPSDFQERFNGLVEMGAPIKRMQFGGMTFPSGAFLTGMNTGDNAPAKRQASLRDVQSITPEQLQQTYQNQGLPGFGPEIMYFTEEKGKDPNPYKGWLPDAPETAPLEVEEGAAQKAKFEYDPAIGEMLKSGEITYPQYVAIMSGEELDVTSGSQGSGGAATPTAGEMSAEDYMKVYGAYMNYDPAKYKYNFNFAEGGGIQDLAGGTQELGSENQKNQEADRLIELTSMAILGDLPEEESEVVIQAFIDEFGDEAFQMLRDQVLETVVPGSQKEGEIVGSGGGMDDEVMGMIGNQQPVAVSPGEYIVPADVVSGLGDGSTDAGVQELDGMLDRVRVERTNTTQQPAPLRKGGVLPR